jgi:hypothetical protein
LTGRRDLGHDALHKARGIALELEHLVTHLAEIGNMIWISYGFILFIFSMD